MVDVDAKFWHRLCHHCMALLMLRLPWSWLWWCFHFPISSGHCSAAADPVLTLQMRWAKLPFNPPLIYAAELEQSGGGRQWRLLICYWNVWKRMVAKCNVWIWPTWAWNDQMVANFSTININQHWWPTLGLLYILHIMRGTYAHGVRNRTKSLGAEWSHKHCGQGGAAERGWVLSARVGCWNDIKLWGLLFRR